MNTDQPITEPKIQSAAVTTETPTLKVARASDVKNPWRCLHCGAIIGSVLHDKIRAGLSLSRLILFRGAVYDNEMLPANYIFGKVDAGEFGCSRCGTVRPWVPSAETVRYWNEPRRPGKKNRNL